MIVTIPVYLCNVGLEGAESTFSLRSYNYFGRAEERIMSFEDFEEKYPEKAKRYKPAHCSPEETVVILVTFNTEHIYDEPNTRPVQYSYRDYCIGKLKDSYCGEDHKSDETKLPELELDGSKIRFRNVPLSIDFLISNSSKVIRREVKCLNLKYTTGSERWCDVSSILTVKLPELSSNVNKDVRLHHKELHMSTVKALHKAVGSGAFTSLREIDGTYKNIKFFLKTFNITEIERLVVRETTGKRTNRLQLNRRNVKVRTRYYFPGVEIDELFVPCYEYLEAKRCDCIQTYLPTTGGGSMDVIDMEWNEAPNEGNTRVHHPHDLTHLRLKDSVHIKGTSCSDEPLDESEDADETPYWDNNGIDYSIRIKLDRRNRAKNARKVVDGEED